MPTNSASSATTDPAVPWWRRANTQEVGKIDSETLMRRVAGPQSDRRVAYQFSGGNVKYEFTFDDA